MRGVRTQLILDVFGAEQVTALDLDPDMARRVRARLAAYGDRVAVDVGDAEHLTWPDDGFDAVFDFGIIHHIPNWRAAVAEVR
ncbi:MAG: class I SAM-dependent methyltransferase, partial [Acidimicrobiales bacterium]|nr:class I SAM-dependent methyltransferase [Acidimicrobiales bacterium]